MDGFLSWLRNISYDIIGIFLPGFCFLLALPYALYEFSPVEFVQNFSLDPKNPNFFNVASVCIVSYLIGIGLKTLSSLPYMKRLYRDKLASYSGSHEQLYQSARLILKGRYPSAQISQWPEFYSLIKTHVLEKSIPSTLITYQNRYELNNSLSLGALILAAIQAAVIISNFINSAPQVADSLQLSAFFAFYIICRASFRKYWVELGNQAIAHVIMLEGK